MLDVWLRNQPGSLHATKQRLIRIRHTHTLPAQWNIYRYYNTHQTFTTMFFFCKQGLLFFLKSITHNSVYRIGFFQNVGRQTSSRNHCYPSRMDSSRCVLMLFISGTWSKSALGYEMKKLIKDQDVFCFCVKDLERFLNYRDMLVVRKRELLHKRWMKCVWWPVQRSVQQCFLRRRYEGAEPTKVM